VAGNSLSFDVCIICALAEEAEALLKVLTPHGMAPLREQISSRNRAYHYTTIRNNQGEPLSIQVSWLPSYGSIETAIHLNTLLEDFRPRFAAMTGICAGDKRKVALGDIIVAERAFFADSGKIITGSQGQSVHEYDTYTSHAAHDVLQFARMFRSWEQAVAMLQRPHLEHQRDPQLPQCHFASMASCSAVRGDNPFDEIQFPVRGTIAIDMEGAAFYRAVEDFPGTRSLLVKGVSDYADNTKNNTYHKYASLVSATYILYFIREYVTTHTMPRLHRDEAQAKTRLDGAYGASTTEPKGPTLKRSSQEASPSFSIRNISANNVNVVQGETIFISNDSEQSSLQKSVLIDHHISQLAGDLAELNDLVQNGSKVDSWQLDEFIQEMSLIQTLAIPLPVSLIEQVRSLCQRLGIASRI